MNSRPKEVNDLIDTIKQDSKYDKLVAYIESLEKFKHDMVTACIDDGK